MHLLVRHGIQGTTVHAVGEMAGYSRGLATHRFGSKAGLFANVLQVASVDWLERVQAAVGSRVGTEALCAATDAADRFFREQPDEVRTMYLLWFLSIDPSSDYKANLANVHNAQRRDAAHWIRAGQAAGVVDSSHDAERVAEQYVASMAGIAYQWIANPAMPITLMFRQLKEDLVARLGPASAASAKASGRPSAAAAKAAASSARARSSRSGTTSRRSR
ncbi:MAG: TetR/AcrR family transcriptional regulator [Steroidobacteraceae bacterium]